MPSSVARYWHTLKYLKPVQFYGRLWFRIHRPKPDLRPAPPRRMPLAPEQREIGWTLTAERRPSLQGPTWMRFLNEDHDLGTIGWDDPAVPKLWRYNQHYFDDLVADGAEARSGWHRDLVQRWMAENPPGRGTGWEPYPASLRIVNWIKWCLSGEPLTAACVQSLAVQTRWLSQRLEWHLLGNHLLANAKALVFAGVFFEGEEAAGWLEQGCMIYERELEEQILPDGANFELSPMYHAIILEDVLDLLNLNRALPGVMPARLVQVLSQKSAPMRRWLAAMCHPDGQISFFNDAAFAIAPTAASLDAYAQRLGLGTITGPGEGALYLPASSYARLQSARAVVLFDAARVGPDYIPGHAHADTLSFEMSLDGRRLFVNSGTSVYATGAERQRQRATPAHNTVVVDGENSSEVWGGFRVARRALPSDVEVSDQDGALVAAAAHDGYSRLQGSPRHHRKIELGTSSLVVSDLIEGRFARAEARFHLHPSAKAVHEGPHVRIALESTEAVLRAEGASIDIQLCTWHPEFGVAEPNIVVSVLFSGPRCRTIVCW